MIFFSKLENHETYRVLTELLGIWNRIIAHTNEPILIEQNISLGRICSWIIYSIYCLIVKSKIEFHFTVVQPSHSAKIVSIWWNTRVKITTWSEILLFIFYVEGWFDIKYLLIDISLQIQNMLTSKKHSSLHHKAFSALC